METARTVVGPQREILELMRDFCLKCPSMRQAFLGQRFCSQMPPLLVTVSCSPYFRNNVITSLVLSPEAWTSIFTLSFL